HHWSRPSLTKDLFSCQRFCGCRRARGRYDDRHCSWWRHDRYVGGWLLRLPLPSGSLMCSLTPSRCFPRRFPSFGVASEVLLLVVITIPLPLGCRHCCGLLLL